MKTKFEKLLKSSNNKTKKAINKRITKEYFRRKKMFYDRIFGGCP